MPTRKAPTAADTLSSSAMPATSRVRPSTPSSSDSLSFAETSVGHMMAVPRGYEHDDRDCGDGDRDREEDPAGATAGEQRGEQREIERHRQVFHDEDAQDAGVSRLPSRPLSASIWR